MDCHIKTKKRRSCEENRKISPKSQLFKFESHPHVVFGFWNLLKSHYEKWAQKSPEALRHLGFLGWHPNRMHNMSRGAEKDAHDFIIKMLFDQGEKSYLFFSLFSLISSLEKSRGG
ncbi:MAG: hypothetical protein IJZ03_00420 [Clostridia bacterium]|nr:hypothetical protein [Clostridia bacterium]